MSTNEGAFGIAACLCVYGAIRALADLALLVIWLFQHLRVV